MKSHGPTGSMIWRDYRELRAFWLATLAVAIGLETLAGVMITRLGMGQFTLFPMLAWAFVFPALYGLGCAAMMFAGEHESGTVALLRSLPINPVRLLVGRAAFALASTLLLLVGTCGTFFVLRPLLGIKPEDVSTTLGLFAIVPLELFAWGVLTSLVCRRPLTALLLGGMLGAACAIIATGMVGVSLQESSGRGLSSADVWLAALAIRLPIVAVVALVDLRLAARWFTETGSLRGPRRSPSVDTTPKASADSARQSNTTTKPTTELGRLLWQQWRQSRRLLGILGLTALLLVLWGCLRPPTTENPANWEALWPFLLIPLAGVCVFREDWQANRYRCLANYGAAPGRVWLTRQLIWAALSLFILLAALALLFTTCHEVFTKSHSVGSWYSPREPFGGLREMANLLEPLFGGYSTWGHVYTFFGVVLPAVWMLASYACGQFCSIYTRSSIMAAMVTLLMLLFFMFWAIFTAVLWINWLWAVLPIPFILLLATRVRTRDWLLGRSNGRARARAVLIPVAPLLCIVLVVPFYRVYCVPADKPSFTADIYRQPPNDEERETARLYRKAYKMYTALASSEDPEEVAIWSLWRVPRWKSDGTLDERSKIPATIVSRIEANEKAIEAVLATSRRPEYAIPYGAYDDSLLNHYRVRELGLLLIASGNHLTAQGELDAALNRYLGAIRVANQLSGDGASNWGHGLYDMAQQGMLAWAAHPDQTPERLARAAKQYAELETRFPSVMPWLAERWRSAHKTLVRETNSPRSFSLDVTGADGFRRIALSWFPWEQARARRVIDAITSEAERAVERFESDLHGGRKVKPNDSRDARRLLAAARSTCFDRLGLGDRDWVEGFVFLPAQSEACNRAFRVQMALAAWRRQHGELPKKLDELIGVYLDKMPVDPYTGKPFRYCPEGAAKSAMDQGGDNYRPEGLGPFLWSPTFEVIGADGNEGEYFRARSRRHPDYRYTSPWDMCRHGRIYPIP